jgi:uncharacterized protein YlaI
MPAGQAMCPYCWDRVPKDLRKRIDRLTGTFHPRDRRALVDQAIAAAQGAAK